MGNRGPKKHQPPDARVKEARGPSDLEAMKWKVATMAPSNSVPWRNRDDTGRSRTVGATPGRNGASVFRVSTRNVFGVFLGMFGLGTGGI